jgi:acetoin utilization protein AcuB
MLVKYWMSSNVITVDEDASLMKASRLMKEHSIQHLPLLKKGCLVGIVSDRDLKEAQPSRVTSLDIHELYYLLDQVKIKDLESTSLHTTTGESSIEKAAALMLEHKISALPVMDQKGKLEGIITKGDLFRAMVSISGIYQAPMQIGFQVEDRPGSIKEITDVIRTHDGRIVSIIVTYEQAPEDFRLVFIRCKELKDENAFFAELEGKFKVLYRTRDKVA